MTGTGIRGELVRRNNGGSAAWHAVRPDLYERNPFNVVNFPVDETALFSVHLRIDQTVPFAFAAFERLDGFLEDALIRFEPFEFELALVGKQP